MMKIFKGSADPSGNILNMMYMICMFRKEEEVVKSCGETEEEEGISLKDGRICIPSDGQNENAL
jgi:hypothetical protein